MSSTSILVKREFWPTRADLVPLPQPTFISDWKNLVKDGISDDTSTAQVYIVEFGDFECPACRRFEDTLDSIKAEFGSRVSVVFLHFPLSYHKFARPAARAADCAKRQSAFAAMTRMLYQFQDSLGLWPWVSYANMSGVSDTAAFVVCMNDAAPVTAIEAGLAAGRRINVSATPTIIVNGWRFPHTPSRTTLSQTIADLLAGRQPRFAK